MGIAGQIIVLLPPLCSCKREEKKREGEKERTEMGNGRKNRNKLRKIWIMDIHRHKDGKNPEIVPLNGERLRGHHPTPNLGGSRGLPRKILETEIS